MPKTPARTAAPKAPLWLKLLTFALVYAALARLALAWFSADGTFGVFWPASGLALAVLQQGAPKFWVAGKLVDGNTQQTQSTQEKVRDLMQAEPALVVIPAHDSTVQERLGYFPAWVK